VCFADKKKEEQNHNAATYRGSNGIKQKKISNKIREMRRRKKKEKEKL
jgi:hypothetical protein